MQYKLIPFFLMLSLTAAFNQSINKVLIINEKPTQKLYQANLREILIEDENIQDFSGEINFMMNKRDFLFIYDSRRNSETIEDDRFGFQILDQNPSGLLEFKFNEVGFLSQVEMLATFDKRKEVRFHFRKIDGFFEQHLGKSITLNEFAEKMNMENTYETPSWQDYRIWYINNIIVFVHFEKLDDSNGESFFSLELKIVEYSDDEINQMKGKK